MTAKRLRDCMVAALEPGAMAGALLARLEGHATNVPAADVRQRILAAFDANVAALRPAYNDAARRFADEHRAVIDSFPGYVLQALLPNVESEE